MKNNMFLGHFGQLNIRFKFRASSWEETGSKVIRNTFSETMGGHDSYSGTFTSRVNAKETRVRGGDHRGEVRIGGKDQGSAMHYGWSGQVCKAARRLKESTQ